MAQIHLRIGTDRIGLGRVGLGRVESSPSWYERHVASVRAVVGWRMTGGGWQMVGERSERRVMSGGRWTVGRIRNLGGGLVERGDVK